MTVTTDAARSLRWFSGLLRIIRIPMSAARLSEITAQNCIEPMTAEDKIITMLDVQKLAGRR